ncbi:hypothetical protein, partial [Helicobacter pylori]
GTTQLTIPNLEVKLFIADNTALFKSGNVGRCRDREMFFSLAFLSFSLILFLMFSVWFRCCWFVLGVYGFISCLYHKRKHSKNFWQKLL